jgi:maleate isomerase
MMAEKMYTFPAALRRAGLGLIVPSVNRVVECDWRWAWPADVPCFVARARYEFTSDASSRLCGDALRAAEDLAGARPSFGMFAYTIGGYTSGDNSLDDALTERMNCPVVTAATAVVDGLRAVGAQEVAVVTPYSETGVAKAAGFLTRNGFTTTHACGMGIADGSLESAIEPAEILAYATSELAPGSADTVLISCTNYRAWEIAAELEDRLDLPVITSNQAMAAAALRALDAPGLAPRTFGRLFTTFDRHPVG